MKIDAMLEWSAEERTAKRKEWTQSLFGLRLQKATGQLENPMKIRELKKDLARLATLDHMAVAPAPKGAEAPAAESAAPAAAAPAPARKATAAKAPARKAAPAKKSAKAPARKAAAKPAPAKKSAPKKADKKVKK